MKVTLKYEESEDKEFHTTLRLTLPPKYKDLPTKNVVKLFVDHYNKKHPNSTLDADVLHLKLVGGDHLDAEAIVGEVLSDKDECYLMGVDALAKRAAKRAADASDVQSSKPTADDGGAYAPSVPPKVLKDEKGHLKCKRFGCNRTYDPEGPPQECVHHVKPPIFHELCKWWSCCQDKKAYDWDDFMRIPGCQTGFCSNTPEGQQNQKRALGGSDLRGDAAPVRLDADAPPDPRRKLRALREGLISVGVDGALFEKVWGKLAADSNEDVDAVCEQFRARFETVLDEATD